MNRLREIWAVLEGGGREIWKGFEGGWRRRVEGKEGGRGHRGKVKRQTGPGFQEDDYYGETFPINLLREIWRPLERGWRGRVEGKKGRGRREREGGKNGREVENARDLLLLCKSPRGTSLPCPPTWYILNSARLGFLESQVKKKECHRNSETPKNLFQGKEFIFFEQECIC
jgi:hypothetical protein